MVPWNRVLGEKGETAIKTRLLDFSNPMKLPVDFHIDFYCQLYSSPSLAFYVQAKGTEHFNKKWGRSISKNTIINWVNLPHPVYLIVYDDISKTCYWTSVEEHRNNLIERMKTKSRTIYITMDRCHILEDGRNDEFVRKVIEDSRSIDYRVSLVYGRPQPIGEGYVKKIPFVHLPDWLMMNIRGNIRMSIMYLINHYFYLAGDLEKAYPLCRFLADFDKSHYNHFLVLGRICKLLGKKGEARRSFDEAIKICKRDTKWDRLKKPSDPSIKDIITLIEQEKKSLDQAGNS